MPEPRSYHGAKEVRRVDNLFWHLERYFEALDIDDEKEKVQKLYLDSVDDQHSTAEAEGNIHEYVKEYSALMLKIPEMSETQRLCFFVDGLQQWVAIELRRREPHDLSSAMVIVERLGDFKQRERPRSPRHERAKDGGDGRSKNGLPKETDDERSGDEGLREHLQQTVASQVELIFNRLDDLEIDSRLTVLEQKVYVFAEELDDLIEERVAHFTKWEVQQRKDLKGQVMELQEELATCKKELTRATRHGQSINCVERKVDVFAEELDDLIEERVAHFTKWEVQQRKDLQGQVTKLQEELAACKKELTRATRQGCIGMQPRGKKMLEPRSYDGTRERYFEALDIDDEKEKVQTVVMYLNDIAALRWRRRYTDGCDVKMWEMFKHEIKRQFYPESVVDIAMINLQWLRKKGSIHKYVKEYSALMLKIPEMSERQRLCFFVDGLQYWVAIELRRREPHNLASAMMIVERLGDFKQCERPRSPRHERAKGRGDGRSKSGSPKATDDERNGDEGHRRHYERKKKHEGSHKHGDSRDHKAHKSKEEIAKEKKSKKRWGLLYATVDVAGKTQEALVDTGATHNFMSPRVAEWLRLKPTKDGSWFTAMNAEERPTKGVVKNVNLRTGGWTWKVNFNIIDMDELGVVLRMDFMEKSSTTLNPYCGVMMMAGKEGQPKWMIPLVSKDGLTHIWNKSFFSEDAQQAAYLTNLSSLTKENN
ncbi:hypothetical protein RJ639_005231 [Escallonia herrerae]|uniref:Ty3 transposon capsid-like protein domain-containing protein n=1 Tax=Escallonia herrerae TaxID=1293975 RepID=A0AA88VZM7_9ASTE|nr:hypothetical protein RJ639_005231 [Escallonia herrerae]